MIVVVYIGGLLSRFGAAYHLFFWKMFGWSTDLESLTPVNNAIIQVLNLCLIWVFLMTGVICLAFPVPLITTDLGRFFLTGWSVFWLARTIQQFIFFESKGRKTVMLNVTFVALAILFIIPVIL